LSPRKAPEALPVKTPIPFTIGPTIMMFSPWS
jgi:hypothetical protein